MRLRLKGTLLSRRARHRGLVEPPKVIAMMAKDTKAQVTDKHEDG
jgi:hypothetical protein